VSENTDNRERGEREPNPFLMPPPPPEAIDAVLETLAAGARERLGPGHIVTVKPDEDRG
jgi:hypothetical protein